MEETKKEVEEQKKEGEEQQKAALAQLRQELREEFRKELKEEVSKEKVANSKLRMRAEINSEATKSIIRAEIDGGSKLDVATRL